MEDLTFHHKTQRPAGGTKKRRSSASWPPATWKC